MGLLVFETLEIHFLPHHSRSDAPLRSLFYAPGAADRPSATGRGPARSGHVWTAGFCRSNTAFFSSPLNHWEARVSFSFCSETYTLTSSSYVASSFTCGVVKGFLQLSRSLRGFDHLDLSGILGILNVGSYSFSGL